MSAPRRWARRAALSMLAGSGLGAAGFGGPLAGGALGAETPTGATTAEEQAPAVTETTPQAPASGQEAGGSGASEGAAGGASEANEAGGAGSNTTSTAAPPALPSTSTAPSAAAPAAGDGGEAERPTVVVQHSQQTTPGRRHGASVTGSGSGTAGGESSSEGGGPGQGEGAAKGGPTTAPPGAPNGVAPAPQAAGEETSVLATLLTGSTVSAQALDFYRIPLFLLPVYQAAAFQYDVPWQVLAGINEIETNYGADLSVSSAGALGWMQFMPGTWLQYGVDATNAGYADPYNPVDAIFAAARYLHAAGASHHLRAAIFSYNHSQEYVESVLLRARLIASYPSGVIATLTGLVDGRAPTLGAHLAPGAPVALTGAGAGNEGPTPPVSGVAAAGGASNATAGAVPAGLPPTPAVAGSTPAAAGSKPAAAGSTPAAAGSTPAVAGSKPAPSPRVAAARAQAAANAPAKPSQLVELLGEPGAPVVAAEDGRVEHLGHSPALGHYLVLRDIYGDVFTYAGLGSLAPRYRPAVPSMKRRIAPSQEPKPTSAATAGHQSPLTLKVKAHAIQALSQTGGREGIPIESEGETAPAGMGRVRLFAHPENPVARTAAHAGRTVSAGGGWAALKVGSIVAKGTVLGHLDTPPGATGGQMRFAVRPAGDSSTIDPQPLLQNWRQLGAALHPKGSKSTDTLLGATAGDALSMSKGELERAVLADAGIQLDACGRRDVAGGRVDRRLLATLLFLSRSGMQPTVGALSCPSERSAAGLSVVTGTSASAALSSAARQAAIHGDGRAVDITAINDIPIAGHQGPGSVTDAAIRTLLTLHGQFAPHQIVSLMRYPEAPSTQALPAAWNHIHLEFLPPRAPASAHIAASGAGAASPLAVNGSLNENQWSQLIGRIAALPKPVVSVTPSSAAIRDPQAAPANRGLGAGGSATTGN